MHGKKQQSLLDRLVGAGEQQRRHNEANGSRGPEIDDQGLADRGPKLASARRMS
jgi:hypothetical protein